jgi:hypothetical protein
MKKVKSSIFWGIPLNSPLIVKGIFRETCHLHLQGWGVNQARNQHEAGSKQSLVYIGFLLGLLFNPEKGYDFFQTVD